jgi:regulatory protein
MKIRNESEILHLVASYCSVAERCIRDVRRKIALAGASPEAEERILARLQKDQFVDEARFCRSFVKDKFRFNRWGHIRLDHELRRRGIAPDMIAEAIGEMDEKEYRNTLLALLKEKKRSVKKRPEWEVFNRLYRFAAGRGFEGHLIVQCLKSLFKDDFNIDDFNIDDFDTDDMG